MAVDFQAKADDFIARIQLCWFSLIWKNRVVELASMGQGSSAR
jgi:hypothetical protein